MTWHQSDIRSSARFGDLVWAVARDGNADRQRANNHAATDGLTSLSGSGMAQRVLGASRDVLLESLMCPLVLHAVLCLQKYDPEYKEYVSRYCRVSPSTVRVRPRVCKYAAHFIGQLEFSVEYLISDLDTRRHRTNGCLYSERGEMYRLLWVFGLELLFKTVILAIIDKCTFLPFLP